MWTACLLRRYANVFTPYFSVSVFTSNADRLSSATSCTTINSFQRREVSADCSFERIVSPSTRGNCGGFGAGAGFRGAGGAALGGTGAAAAFGLVLSCSGSSPVATRKFFIRKYFIEPVRAL